MDKAVVLLSGGLDSSTALWWAKNKWEVLALSFNLYLRSKKEKEAAKAIAERAGVELKVIDLKFIRELAAIKPDKALNPHRNTYPEYIPNKNMIFFSLAAYWAEIIGAKHIVGANTREDIFPDAKSGYLERLNDLISIGLLTSVRHKVTIISPLIDKDKVEVVKLAKLLGVPLRLTWSCHRNTNKACGTCNGCRTRLEAFSKAGVKDPVEYLNKYRETVPALSRSRRSSAVPSTLKNGFT